jgi:hypothetical protein
MSKREQLDLYKMQLPEDQYSSGHSDAQCWAKVYGRTRGELQDKIDSYLESYPPFGYHTTVDKIVKENGHYCAHLSRWHSCD